MGSPEPLKSSTQMLQHEHMNLANNVTIIIWLKDVISQLIWDISDSILFKMLSIFKTQSNECMGIINAVQNRL